MFTPGSGALVGAVVGVGGEMALCALVAGVRVRISNGPPSAPSPGPQLALRLLMPALLPQLADALAQWRGMFLRFTLGRTHTKDSDLATR